MTLLTCNYDTPEITEKMLKSFCKTSTSDLVNEIIIMDTSPVSGGLNGGLYNECKIISTPNLTHGNAVNQALEEIEGTCLLVDSDVIFYKDVKKIYDVFTDGGYVLGGEVVGDRGGKKLYQRVNPWFCFINNEVLRSESIKFYDELRTERSKKEGDRVYDIGSTMFEDVVNIGGLIADFKVEGKYFKHYEGMSWRTKKYNPNDVDTDIDQGGTHPNKALYEYGLMVEHQYREDTKHL